MGHFIISTSYHDHVKTLVLALSGRTESHFTTLWGGGHITVLVTRDETFSVAQGEGVYKSKVHGYRTSAVCLEEYEPRCTETSVQIPTSMNILGLNAFHGDASAALVRDGQLVAAIEEERLIVQRTGLGFHSVRQKHASMPHNQITTAGGDRRARLNGRGLVRCTTRNPHLD